MSEHIELVVSGQPAGARSTTEQALARRKIQVIWQDDRLATAERGSKAANWFCPCLWVGIRLIDDELEVTTFASNRHQWAWQ